MADKFKSILNGMSAPMVMKISNDRVRTRPDYVPDMAESGGGVFALLSDDELSPAEKERMNRGTTERAARAAGQPMPHTRARRIWSPKEIFRKTIMLYKKLKPVRGNK